MPMLAGYMPGPQPLPAPLIPLLPRSPPGERGKPEVLRFCGPPGGPQNLAWTGSPAPFRGGRQREGLDAATNSRCKGAWASYEPWGQARHLDAMALGCHAWVLDNLPSLRYNTVNETSPEIHLGWRFDPAEKGRGTVNRCGDRWLTCHPLFVRREASAAKGNMGGHPPTT